MISKEGFPFIGAAILTAFLFYFVYWPLCLLFALTAAAFIFFFRNPKRAVLENSDCIFSPADGTITAVEAVDEKRFGLGKCTRVRIFLSILDVHAIRAPYAGKVENLQHEAGVFKWAFHDQAYDKNECNWILIGGEFKLLMRQIAGKIARRIVCYLKEGQTVLQNEPIGFIRFGSGTEIFIPAEFAVCVAAGKKVQGGISVLARKKK